MEISAESIKASGLKINNLEAENVASFINGLLDRAKGDGLEEAFALEDAERPCGRDSGPCCGGKCG